MEGRASIRVPDVWGVPIADIIVVGPVISRIIFQKLLAKGGQCGSSLFSAVPPLETPSAFIDEGHVAPKNGFCSNYSQQNLIQMLVVLHEEDDHADNHIHGKLIENDP